MSGERTQPTDSIPWYREPWPWLLIALPTASVIGSLATLIVATRGADSLVRDDWYRAGQAINRSLERDHIATHLALRADLSVRATTGELSLELTGRSAEPLTDLVLQLDHPTLTERDARIVLSRRTPGGPYVGRLPGRAPGRWYATLTPMAAESQPDHAPWRLRGVVQLPSEGPIRLEHEPL